MARHAWYKAPNRLRDPRFAALTPAARAVLMALQEMLAEEAALEANVSTLASWTLTDRKIARAAVEAFQENGILEVEVFDRGKAGTFYRIANPDQTPTKPQASPDHAPTMPRPNPNHAPDKSANNAGLRPSSLIRREEKRREEIPPNPPSGERESEQSQDGPRRFAEFWAAYPRKRSRGQAIKAWEKLRPDDALVDRILEAVEAAKRSRDWLKDGGAFIPHPATWLNAQGWEDELTVPIPAQHVLDSCNLPVL